MIPFLILCADLVLRNGKIVTLDAAKPQAEAMAITAGKIVAVGTNAQMAREIQPSTKVIDLNGHLAIPGFIEGHGHFMGVGEDVRQVLQDFLAPEMREIRTRLDAMEEVSRIRYENLTQRLEFIQQSFAFDKRISNLEDDKQRSA